MTTPVRWWDKLVVITGKITVWDQVLAMVVIAGKITVWLRGSPLNPEWFRLWSTNDHRVVVYSWCCARIMGKNQAPCGHLMITTVLFIPSLIWPWDDRVMSEVGKWCMWWLRSNPSRINSVYSVIMLHASIVRFICSCQVHVVLAIPCSCWYHVAMMISC